MKTFFIADTHFGDPNISIYENRKFSDEDIISNWNKEVSKNDTIYIVGDFSNYNIEKQKNLLSQLNGYKILIKGNHDNLQYKQYLEIGFDEVYFHPVIIDNFWILSHEPLYINMSMPYINIFGHVHQNPIYKDYSERSFCVCVERINYKPIEFSKIKEKIFLMNSKNN